MTREDNNFVQPSKLGILERLSIRRRLIVIIMSVSSAVMIFMAGTFIFFQMRTSRDQMINDLSVHAAMLADNCTASLSFHNARDAGEVLNSLQALIPVMQAGIYDEQNNLFALYRRGNLDSGTAAPEPGGPGCRFEKNSLIIFQPIFLDDRQVGTIFLQSDLSEQRAFLQRSFFVLSFIVFSAIIASYGLARKLQGTISRPVLHLAEVANTVAQSRDYSLRAAKDREDEIGLLTAAFNDMLSEIQARDIALRESRRNLQTLFDTVDDFLIVFDTDASIIKVNPVVLKRLGYSEEEIIGNPVSQLHPPAQHEEAGTIVADMLAGKRDNYPIPLMTKYGKKIPVETKINKGEWGGSEAIFGISRDITERQIAQKEQERLIAELEMKNAELEQFAYTVSHDLKSPLITIKGFLGFVEKDAFSGNLDRLKVDIQRIYSAVDKMQKLLDDLLELSRVGRIINEPEEIDFIELAKESSEMVAGRLKEKGIDLFISQDMPTIRGDRSRLLEVLQNLLDNATKFTHEQKRPSIEIACRNIDSETVFYVRDNGIGIEPRYHEKIFTIFEQLSRKAGGTGIGLAIVKRIIEVHGGRIWVESEGIGKGSTFCFTLQPQIIEQ